MIITCPFDNRKFIDQNSDFYSFVCFGLTVIDLIIAIVIWLQLLSEKMLVKLMFKLFL